MASWFNDHRYQCQVAFIISSLYGWLIDTYMIQFSDLWCHCHCPIDRYVNAKSWYLYQGRGCFGSRYMESIGRVGHES